MFPRRRIATIVAWTFVLQIILARTVYAQNATDIAARRDLLDQAQQATAANELEAMVSFYPGSGGGGGGGYGEYGQGTGGGGGGGGGALRISSPVSITLTSTARLRADGGDGGDNTDERAGGGGGGSGGLIFLFAPAIGIPVGATVSSAGGHGGNSMDSACQNRGGDGGLGRIRISATNATCMLAEAFTPPLIAGCTASASTAGSAFVGTYRN